MPTYIVRSGDFTGTVETPFEAAPDIIATIAFLDPGESTRLGIITSVTGGKYIGDSETYVSTMLILEKMGRFDGDTA